MNEARRRRLALKQRLAQHPPQPQSTVPEDNAGTRALCGGNDDLVPQLEASIKQVEDRKKIHVMVDLRTRQQAIIPDFCFVRISRDQPTRDILAMQKDGFWTEQYGRPVYIPPDSVLKVMILEQQ